MKKYILGAVLSLGILVSPAFTQAATLTDAQVQAILSLLSSFGADSATVSQVSAVLTGSTSAPSPARWCHKFNTDLTFGNSGAEVLALHKALINEGLLANYYIDTNSFEGASSFNESSAAAVVQLQAKYGIRQTGYVGPLTRAKLNRLYGCGNQTQPPTPSAATISTSAQTTNTTPYIIGTASGVTQVGIVLSSSSGDRVYGSGLIPVTNGNWSVTVSPALALGHYTIKVSDANNNLLTTGSITIVAANTTQQTISISGPEARPANIVAGGSAAVPAGSLTFAGRDSAYTVTNLSFVVPTSARSSVSSVIVRYKSRAGVVQTATAAVPNVANAVVAFSNLQMYVPANSSASMDVLVTTVPIASGGVSGAEIAFSLEGSSVRAVSDSGAALSYTGGKIQVGGALYLRKSVPTFTMGEKNSTLVPSANIQLYRFNITADAAGDIDWSKVSFNITSSVPITDMYLADITSGFTTVTDNKISVASGNSTLSFDLRNNSRWGQTQTIAAGETRKYALVGNVSSFPSGASLSISLAPDSIPIANTSARLVYGNIAWSDWSDTLDHATNPMSDTTNDWTNGYLLKNFSNTTVSYVSNVSNGTLSFSKTSFSAEYVQGTTLPTSQAGQTNTYTNTPYFQSLTFTNTSSVPVIYTLSVPNQPAWLNSSFATTALTASPGSVTGLGAYLDPATVASTPGTYTTRIIVSGNFSGSPITIPVTLTVRSASAAAPTIDSFSASPASVYSGQVTTLSWRTSNAASCTGSINGLSGLNGSTVTPVITSAQTYTLTCSGSGGTASRSVTVSVNAGTPPTTPAPSLHLTATSGGVSSDTALTVAPGSTFSISGTPQNLSGLNYFTDYTRAWFFDPLLNNVCTNNGADNAVWEMTCTPTASGSANMRVDIYRNGQTYSSNTVQITVGAPADLVISGLTVTPASPYVNSPVTVKFKLLNQGKSPASPALYSYVSHADGVASLAAGNTCTGSSILAPNQSCVAAYTFVFPVAGTKQLKITADPNNQVVEANESNNSITKSIVVSEAAPPPAQPTCTWFGEDWVCTDTTQTTQWDAGGASVANAFASAFGQEQSPVQSRMHFEYVWNRDLQMGSPYVDDVTALQKALTEEGLFTGEVTGGFYTQTYLAVKRFQQIYGIEATGFVGTATRAQLNSLY